MNYDIAVIAGDGIGPEVTGQAVKVLNSAVKRFGFSLKLNELPYGANHYLKTGIILPEAALSEIGAAKAVLLGAVGDPRVPMGPLEQELLLALRFHFDLYLNLRPAKSFPNVKTPINTFPQDKTLDLLVVRENTEDFYMGLGGQGQGSFNSTLTAKRKLYSLECAVDLKTNPKIELAVGMGILTAPAIRRITGKACEMALDRGENRIHLATKANALPQFYGFWNEQVNLAAKDYPTIKLISMNIDNMCYQLPRAPLDFGVILCPNLFGDIVSDLASSLIGGLGLSPSANIGDGVSMFEPVHGSAPDIAGTGRANPLAAILSVALMLKHLGEIEAAKAVEAAVTGYLQEGQSLPFEVGGEATVEKVGQIIAQRLEDELDPGVN
ncbi:MAG: isocitrate/isopropylmalate dehydrogenase family protein [Deltaproteobacteria bacterium]|jgi:3-isopropylmalate dehydrogenase|nr:isocitrate/isopropylmalate dehydrogenase family protein [Deltaproteobacteria bacterium]